jgi:hypothetical protein
MGNQQSVIQQIQAQMPQRISVIGDPCIFEARKYSERYPDLQNAFNGDSAALKKHYIDIGLREGRSPCGDINPNCRFDEKIYKSLNIDLSSSIDLTMHYKQYGINEGRAVCPGLSQAPPAPPPPPNPSLLKEQKRVELNMAKADVKAKQAEYDKLTPDESIKRKTDEGTKESSKYISDVQIRMGYELELYKSNLSEVNDLANSPAFKLAQKYKTELSKKYNEVEKENKKYKEDYVTNRRRFLDNNPDEPVNGMFGFASIDDRIYLLFWITFLLFLLPISHHIIDGLGLQLGDEKARFYIWIIVSLVACFISDMALRYLA